MIARRFRDGFFSSAREEVRKRSPASIVNVGEAAWLFADLAASLARDGAELITRVGDLPRVRRAYLLGWDEALGRPPFETIVPYDSILLVADKRRMYETLIARGVPIPETRFLESTEVIDAFLRERGEKFVLKYPSGCGAVGHRIVTRGLTPSDLKAISKFGGPPYILQRFVPTEPVAVHRLYCLAGRLFGWNVRRFPEDVPSSPWVAHARGARYCEAGEVPWEAHEAAADALDACGLLSSFGCVDLLRDAETGRWLVLECGADGGYTHVDREIGIARIEEAIDAGIRALLHAEPAQGEGKA